MKMQKNEKLTKREKLLICTTIVATCAAGYFGYKYFGDYKQIKKLTDDTTTLMSAASEGLFDEALATVGRKIAYRKDREQYLLKQLVSHPGESDLSNCLDRVQSELSVLTERQSKFINAQKLYEIKDSVDI